MVMKFTNNATSTLAAGITNSATSLSVASGQGALFPPLSAGDYFYCTLANTSGAIEIVKVTARSTDTFTITRAQDGTTGLAWNTGDKVELRVVAAELNDFAKKDETKLFTQLQSFADPSDNTKIVQFLISALTTGNIRQVTVPDASFTMAAINLAQAFTKAQAGAIVALTDGATITPDFSAGNNFSVTLGGNRTLANPTNITAGTSGVIFITQDGTGSRTLAFGSYWKFPNKTAPTLTTAASSVDMLVFTVQSATLIDAVLISNMG